MLGENFFSDEYKSSVIQAIIDAVSTDIHDFIYEHEPESYNGIDFLAWDFINKNLVRNVADDTLVPIKVKRGRWTFVMLYDNERKYLYVFMKRKRFKQLQEQRKKRSAAHYIDALALLNNGLYAECEQLALFENEKWNEDVEALLYKIVGEYRDIIKHCVVIGFTTYKNNVSNVSAILPSSDLGIVYEENWSEFIPAHFDTSIGMTDYTPSKVEEDEIPIRLKKLTDANDDLPLNLKKSDNNINNKEI